MCDMSELPTALERAFELARSGDYATIEDLKNQLRHEGYTATQIQGPTLVKQLREIMKSTYRLPNDPSLSDS
jgi:hypothetical protein